MHLSGVDNLQVINPFALYTEHLQQFKWNNIFRKMKDNRKQTYQSKNLSHPLMFKLSSAVTKMSLALI